MYKMRNRMGLKGDMRGGVENRRVEKGKWLKRESDRDRGSQIY
jgi:hypothetical protein